MFLIIKKKGNREKKTPTTEISEKDCLLKSRGKPMFIKEVFGGVFSAHLDELYKNYSKDKDLIIHLTITIHCKITRKKGKGFYDNKGISQLSPLYSKRSSLLYDKIVDNPIFLLKVISIL